MHAHICIYVHIYAYTYMTLCIYVMDTDRAGLNRYLWVFHMSSRFKSISRHLSGLVIFGWRVFGRSSLLFFFFLPKEVGGPIDQVEECKHEWEENSRDDIDAFGAGRESVHPFSTQIDFRTLHVHFALAHLLGVEITVMVHQGLLGRRIL